MSLNISNIEKVYSGKIGCMCGCQGKYSYNEGEDGQGTVSVRSVKVIAGKVLNNPAAVRTESANYVFVEDRAANKIRVVYFKQ
jgi:hypothetical protein